MLRIEIWLYYWAVRNNIFLKIIYSTLWFMLRRVISSINTIQIWKTIVFQTLYCPNPNKLCDEYIERFITIIYGLLLLTRNDFAKYILRYIFVVEIINWPLQNIINTKLCGSYAYYHIMDPCQSYDIIHNILLSPSIKCYRQHSLAWRPLLEYFTKYRRKGHQ